MRKGAKRNAQGGAQGSSRRSKSGAGTLAYLLPFSLDTVIVEGDSMAPTFQRGDWLLIRHLTPSAQPRVNVGEVVLIEREEQPGALFIKRITDIRGDSPNRHYPTYWVEGDNKELSHDSRKWGAIDGYEIVGRVLLRIKRAQN